MPTKNFLSILNYLFTQDIPHMRMYQKRAKGKRKEINVIGNYLCRL